MTADTPSIEQIPIDQLRPDPANPRRISDDELEALDAEHPRVRVRRSPSSRGARTAPSSAATSACWRRAGSGSTTVPVIWLDISAEQARLLGLALNKISGDWDDAAPGPPARRPAGGRRPRPLAVRLRRGRDEGAPAVAGDPREARAAGVLRPRRGAGGGDPGSHAPSPVTSGSSVTIACSAVTPRSPRTWHGLLDGRQAALCLHRPALQRQPR